MPHALYTSLANALGPRLISSSCTLSTAYPQGVEEPWNWILMLGLYRSYFTARTALVRNHIRYDGRGDSNESCLMEEPVLRGSVFL